MSGALWRALEDQLAVRRDGLEQVGRVAAEMGYRSALVGGGVRDLLLHRPVKDLDVVIEGEALRVGRQLVQAHGGRVLEHEAFGTATWQTVGGAIDLASARTETYAHPGALPDVSFASLDDDLARRDFSINAMALHLHPDHRGELMDVFDGQSDLEHRVLRILHPKSFQDDLTRGWRGARYASRYGLRWAEATATALREAVSGGAMAQITLQRQGAEWDKVLGESDVIAALHQIIEFGLLACIHPEFSVDSQCVSRIQAALTSGRGACYGRLDGLREALWLALAMGLSDAARAQCRDVASGQQGRSDRWVEGPKRIRQAQQRLAERRTAAEWGTVLKSQRSPELIVLHSAGGVHQEAVQWWLDTGRNQRSVVSASGLMARGVPQGPLLGTALDAAQRCAWEGGSEDAQWIVAVESARQD